jgi:phosphatidylserine/phosphatidylglycerophosphate/cardiolipin synthase-like enzyme
MVIHDRNAPPGAFLPSERRLINRLDTPLRVQGFLNRLPYNMERRGETLRSFRQVLRRGRAHCLEAALAAACVLEQHGHPPLVMSLASVDKLDHVIFVYRRRGRWGSVARSRDPGLHGRKPVFRSLRALAESYFDPYIDRTGRITGFALFDLRRMGIYDWRLSRRNVWAVERKLLRLGHKKIKRSGQRVRRLRVKYRAYLAKHNRKPLFYRGRDKWTLIPTHFL